MKPAMATSARLNKRIVFRFAINLVRGPAVG
jgi:hypothetical protein